MSGFLPDPVPTAARMNSLWMVLSHLPHGYQAGLALSDVSSSRAESRPGGAPNSRRSGEAGAEGSLGANMSVIAAGLDCHKGRYNAGIKTLETILDGQRIPYPPG
jgi:hypothetical protein